MSYYINVERNRGFLKNSEFERCRKKNPYANLLKMKEEDNGTVQ